MMGSKKIPTWTGGDLSFALHRINTHLIHLRAPTKKLEVKKDSIDMTYAISTAIKLYEDRHTASLDLHISGKVPETEEVIYQTALSFLFKLDGIPEGVFLHEVLDNDDNLVFHMLSMSYSTARGIVYQQGAGTVMQHSLLPTIDPNSLLVDMKAARKEASNGGEKTSPPAKASKPKRKSKR